MPQGKIACIKATSLRTKVCILASAVTFVLFSVSTILSSGSASTASFLGHDDPVFTAALEDTSGMWRMFFQQEEGFYELDTELAEGFIWDEVKYNLPLRVEYDFKLQDEAGTILMSLYSKTIA